MTARNVAVFGFLHDSTIEWSYTLSSTCRTGAGAVNTRAVAGFPYTPSGNLGNNAKAYRDPGLKPVAVTWVRVRRSRATSTPPVGLDGALRPAAARTTTAVLADREMCQARDTERSLTDDTVTSRIREPDGAPPTGPLATAELAP
jgi:hypothetical protein